MTSDAPTRTTERQPVSAPATAGARTAGYAPVNGLRMYYEVHGPTQHAATPQAGPASRPLVLLHGGLLTAEQCFADVLPALAADRTVVLTELQGHGHTADIDREVSLTALSDDVAALLDHLGIDRADLLGFSLGALVALQTVLRHPARVDHLVLCSAHYRPDGYHREVLDPSAYATSVRLPTADDFRQLVDAYRQVAPDPGHFEEFAAKCTAAVTAFTGWDDDDLRSITAPVLLVVGDTDFVRIEHAATMFRLIPDARLAVLPHTTHMAVMRHGTVLPAMVEALLNDAGRLGGDRH